MITEEIQEAILRHFTALDFWGPHWPEAAVVILGSAVRGPVDEFSDVDIVVYVPEQSYPAIYENYREAIAAGDVAVLNPSALQYGEFPFALVPGVKGHYRVHAFEEPEGLAGRHDDVTMWVHQGSIALHDPSRRYERLRKACAEYPEAVWREKVRFHYLEAVWTGGAAKNPMRRNDWPALALTMTEGLKHLLRLCCLLDRRPFPYEKWLYREALATEAGQELRPVFERLFEELGRREMRRATPEQYELPGHRDADLEEFPLYQMWLKVRKHLEARLPGRRD